MKSIATRIKEAAEQVFQIRVIHVLVGKKKKPIDDKNKLIFHIDI